MDFDSHWRAIVDAAGDGYMALRDIPLSRQIALAKAIHTQATQYESVGDEWHACVFLQRFLTLVVHSVLKHKGINEQKFAKDYDWCRREAARTLDMLERAKADMKERFRSEVPIAEPPAPTPAPAETGGRVDEPGAPPHRPSVSDDEWKRALQALSVPASRGGPEAAAPGPPRAPEPVMAVPSAPRDGPPPPGVIGWRSGNGEGHNPWLQCGGIIRGLLGSPPREEPDLRPLKIPAGVVDLFTDIAAENSQIPPRGIETCGLLCGRIARGGNLVMSHLVIPKQRAAADWCEMTNEEELFDYCLSNNLVQVGWIHTHPSQDCFMSSYDVRTHLGFQLMVPEAVAIVVSPRDPAIQHGVFRITEPEGRARVQARTDSRPVEVPDGVILYESSPHVDVLGWQGPHRPLGADAREFTIVDLR